MASRLAIIGPGLIGGSLGWALKKRQYAGTIVVAGTDHAEAQQMVAIGAADVAFATAEEAVEGADMVVLATPLGAIRPLLQRLVGRLSPTTVISDTGSAKCAVIEDALAVLGDLRRLVPAHPIAGREHCGIAAAQPDLFQGRRVILTPTPDSQPTAIAAVTDLWQQAGADVEHLDAEQHDRWFATTSHLPHLLAYALVELLARHADQPHLFRYAASGFADFTRIASSDAVMWRDICLANKAPVGQALQDFSQLVTQLHQLVENSDAEGLYRMFDGARQIRNRHLLAAVKT